MKCKRFGRINFVGSGVLSAALLAACADSQPPQVGSAEQATAGSGVTASTLASSSLGEAEVEIKWNGEEAKVEDTTTLVMQQLTFQPGGHTGWHTHGGPVLVSIVSGSVTLSGSDAPCEGEVYGPGTAFVDPGGDHVHIARNQGTTPAVVMAQYILPAGAPPRIDAPAPAGSECP